MNSTAGATTDAYAFITGATLLSTATLYNALGEKRYEIKMHNTAEEILNERKTQQHE
jgi:hypothetical protein